MYCTPEHYNPPLEKDLSENTQYPNLNSEEYRRKFCIRKKEVRYLLKTVLAVLSSLNRALNEYLVIRKYYKETFLTIFIYISGS